MKRVSVDPRTDADQKARRTGVVTIERRLPNGKVNKTWDESSAYIISRKEVDDLLEAVNPVIRMGREAVDFLLDGDWGTLGIPLQMFESLRDSFDSQELEFITRYDFAYLGNGQLKLVGIEADSPRSLIETAHTQRAWLFDKFRARINAHKVTQLNSIPELSIEAFRRLREISRFNSMHFASSSYDKTEDLLIANFMKGLAETAGWATRNTRIKDLHWDIKQSAWKDTENNYITALFKQYPWEMLLRQNISKDLFENNNLEMILEPSWKTILSNRAILPAMYELYPKSEILSPAFLNSHKGLGNNIVTGPLLHTSSRNEMGILNGRKFTAWGEQQKDFSNQRVLAHRKMEIPKRFRDASGGYRFAYLSFFTIAGNPAGFGIRETRLPILGIHTTFKPHIVML